VNKEDLRSLVDLYDDEIAHWDGELGRIFASLAAHGLLERTLIVLAADHGEMFLFFVPGLRAGRRVEAAVDNVDVVPTALDYLGIDAKEEKLDGESLRQAIEGHAGDGGAARLAFSAQGQLRGVTDGRYSALGYVQ
jgi:arylsulfatase A-like enzyme